MIYANGLKLNISDVCRLTFMDGVEDSLKVVAEVAVTFDVLQRLYAGIGQSIEQHSANLAKIAKAN